MDLGRLAGERQQPCQVAGNGLEGLWGEGWRFWAGVFVEVEFGGCSPGLGVGNGGGDVSQGLIFTRPG